MNLTTRFILLIIILMLPIFILYTMNIKGTNDVIDQQIDAFNQARMDYFRSQLDTSVANASMFAYNLANDLDVQVFTTRYANERGFDRDQMYKTIESKLALLNGYGSPWNNQITLYFPATETAITNEFVRRYDKAYLIGHAEQRWYFEKSEINWSVPSDVFTRLYGKPNRDGIQILESPVIVNVSLPAENIVEMLNAFKTTGINDPFFFRAGEGVLHNSSANDNMIKKLIPYIGDGESNIRKIVKLDGMKYAVYARKSEQLGWTLADYVPLQSIMEPVNRSRTMFYLTLSFLLLLGIAASLMLFMQIQVPLRLLIQNLQKLKDGKFSIRINSRVRNEFQQLYDGFNEMASEIQNLVEYRYLAEIRSKEAMMKQLQSQINPHFLYNCFASLIGMSKMRYNDSIVAMCHNLAQYYKYVTYQEPHVTSMKEELDFVEHYLIIMNMQLNKFDYQIDIGTDAEKCIIPRLLIQPLVENAVLHGLEPKMGSGTIRIVARMDESRMMVTVEDDGVGIPQKKIKRLNEKIDSDGEPTGSGVGIWNVRRRLHYFFGPGTELHVDNTDDGGVIVRMSWYK